MRVLKTLAVGAASLLLLGAAVPARAEYPDRVVRLVVTVSAGSVADGLARIVADKLSELWHQSVIVENRLGIGGIASAAKSTPDGYTLMVNAGNAPVIAKLLNPDAPFEPLKDFVGVTKLASAALVAVVGPDLPVKNLKDFIDLAKKNPGKLNFSSSGISSINYLCSELFRRDSKIELTHLPYKGAPEAITAVLRGDAQFTFTPLNQARQLASAGKVRPIAINEAAANPDLPDAHPVIDTVPGYKCELYVSIVAPAGTPRDVINKVSKDVATILKQPDVVSRMKVYGGTPSATTPEELDHLIKAEAGIYTDIIRASAGK